MDAGKDIFGHVKKIPGAGNEEFVPVLKFNAKAGRFFRSERVLDGSGNFVTEDVDITTGIKFIADFENIEVGYCLFVPGQAPQFILVPIGEEMPARPSKEFKDGVRLMLKLAPSVGGEHPVREMAGTADAFRVAIAQVYAEYIAQRPQQSGMLLVIDVEKIMPVKSGTGARTSTNFHPSYRIVDWKVRPKDLVFVPKSSVQVGHAQQNANVQNVQLAHSPQSGNGYSFNQPQRNEPAPSTGGPKPAQNPDDDWG
jgi:hypothetical protein